MHAEQSPRLDAKAIRRAAPVTVRRIICERSRRAGSGSRAIGKVAAKLARMRRR